MSDNKDNLEFIDEIKVQIQESEEEFIYKTILPFCETITEKKLDKKELEKILRKGMQKSIPLDRIKEAREEMAKLTTPPQYHDEDYYICGVEDCLEILDKLIESEE